MKPPIVDIIRRSIINHEFVTIRHGLNEVTEQMIGVINPPMDDNSAKRIVAHFCEPLERVAKFAAREVEEESTKEVIINLEKLGKHTLKLKWENATVEVVETLETVGETAANNRLVSPALKATEALKNLGEAAVKNRLINPAVKATEALKNVAT